jgi:hypothetical protein
MIGTETRQAFFQRYNYTRPGYGAIACLQRTLCVIALTCVYNTLKPLHTKVHFLIVLSII